jgi:hypothetical protein
LIVCHQRSFGRGGRATVHDLTIGFKNADA